MAGRPEGARAVVGGRGAAATNGEVDVTTLRFLISATLMAKKEEKEEEERAKMEEEKAKKAKKREQAGQAGGGQVPLDVVFVFGDEEEEEEEEEAASSSYSSRSSSRSRSAIWMPVLCPGWASDPEVDSVLLSCGTGRALRRQRQW